MVTAVLFVGVLLASALGGAVAIAASTSVEKV